MKLYKYLIVVTTIVLLTSCTFTENIYINEDGSGKFSVEMDGSSFMAMMPQDSLKTEKAIDSSFSFKKLFEEKKDSISKLPAAHQAQLRKLENFNVRTVMNPEKKEFLFSMSTDFVSTADLGDAMSIINEVQQASKSQVKNNALPDGGFGNNNSELKYSYDGKKFSRKATLLKKEIIETELDSMKQMMNMFYESSTYTLKYHFPKRVKKVSNTTALYSEDRKTITIEFPFSDYMKDPEKLNFEVEFEK
jgi:hypothetical protein